MKTLLLLLLMAFASEVIVAQPIKSEEILTSKDGVYKVKMNVSYRAMDNTLTKDPDYSCSYTFHFQNMGEVPVLVYYRVLTGVSDYDREQEKVVHRTEWKDGFIAVNYPASSKRSSSTSYSMNYEQLGIVSYPTEAISAGEAYKDCPSREEMFEFTDISINQASIDFTNKLRAEECRQAGLMFSDASFQHKLAYIDQYTQCHTQFREVACSGMNDPGSSPPYLYQMSLAVLVLDGVIKTTDIKMPEGEVEGKENPENEAKELCR